jgi:polysaccharide biosynthesis transport protein
MASPGTSSTSNRPKVAGTISSQISPQHYLQLLIHRKWVVVSTCVIFTALTAGLVAMLPDVYRAETLILVDPQKVPESYVKATVTGDVRNRLGTLEQQILSATRLQKIIDTLKLYPEERRTMSREEVIAAMRHDINISPVSDFGRQGDSLQAFRIAYSGKNPNLVARVVTEIASQFIEENLKARQQQATGTTEFLQSQLDETKKTLEEQESKLGNYRLKHIGEMPEQESSGLQILGQLQIQLRMVDEALSRAEQQRNLTQAMMTQSVPVIDNDDGDDSGSVTEPRGTKIAGAAAAAPVTDKDKLTAQLNEKLKRGYTERHPDIQKLRAQIAALDAKEPPVTAVQAAAVKPTVQPAEVKPAAEQVSQSSSTDATQRRPLAAASSNPVLVSQMKTLDAEIAKQKQEQQRLAQQISVYQSKVQAVPLRQMETAELTRDYEMSKSHYSQLLDRELSAETATQLEIRQKGEKFTILDPAQAPEKPYKPDRILLDLAGFVAGLVLGCLFALSTEITGMCITTAEQAAEAAGIAVLEVIPIIETPFDIRHRKRFLWGTALAMLVSILAGSAVLLRYRGY